jgi:hypothetical protein
MCTGVAWALPRDLHTRIEAPDPTGVPASVIIAIILVVLLLAAMSIAVQWSVSGIGQAQVAVVED